MIVGSATLIPPAPQTASAASTRQGRRLAWPNCVPAGAWLNAVPKHAPFRLPTCHMRVAVQRRLGLPLLAAAGSLDRRSVHGMAFDCYGDVAQNDGEAGHQTRHYLVLEAMAKVVKRQERLGRACAGGAAAVSYTHLTLPTILLV